jgi:hypothetical protein
MKKLLKQLGLDAIYGLDAETKWGDKYRMGKQHLPTTEYVIDPRFKLWCMSVKGHDWKKPKVFNEDQFLRWAEGIDWSRTASLSHHSQFDSLILSHHYDIKPAFYFDTMSMLKPLMPIQVGGSLVAGCAAFGRTAKKQGVALLNTMNKDVLTAAEYKHLASYAGDDNEDMWFLFDKLLPYFPLHELRLIDITIKMYAQPSLCLDRKALQEVLDKDVAHKRELVMALGIHKGLPPTKHKGVLLDDFAKAKRRLMSKPDFAALLRAAGVEPPTKVSVKQSESAGYLVEVDAMSKQDEAFVELLGHPRKRVRDLVTARFAVSSAILENRCRRLLGRAHLKAQPVYLNYAGAKTLRWSGGDRANWQNLSSKRKEGGEELRASVHAPKGHKLLIADLSQIEARVNAWFAGQRDRVEAFRAFDTIIGWEMKDGKRVPKRAGPDVYRVTAADIYGKPVEQVTDPERFVGKSGVLMLEFQAGYIKYAKSMRVGAIGPPVDMTDANAATIVKAYRSTIPFITATWKATNNMVKSAFIGRQRIEHGVVAYEGVGTTGYMHLPGGLAIRYDGLQFNEDGSVSYVSEYRANKVKPPTILRTRLYGGILVENRTQALARRVIADHMLALADALPRGRIAMSTHDEIVMVVPNRDAKDALTAANELMVIPPAWAPDLPLAVEAHISERYDK